MISTGNVVGMFSSIFSFTLTHRLFRFSDGRCPLCDRCFGQQTNLDRHLKKHESDGPTILDEDRKRSRAAGMTAAAGARPSGVQLLRPPAAGFYYADLAAVAAAQHHHQQQQQHRRAAIPDLRHNISPILNSRLGMMGAQSPVQSPAQSPSGSSSSDHDESPMNKKARHHEIEEDDEEESAIESSPEEAEEEDDLANSKETIADEDLAESSVKDEADAASEAGSHSSSGASNSSAGAPSSEGNAGVLSCEVTIHTDNKSPTLSPNSAAIIVVTPSS